MADRDEPESPGAGPGESVWSSDDLPARDEPLDIVWRPRPVDDTGPITLQPLQPRQPPHERGGQPTVGAPEGRSLGSKLLLAAAVLAGAAVAVALATRGGDGDGSATPPTTVTPASTSLPTTIETVPPTTTASPTDDRVVPVDVQLPEALAAMQAPTEIVALGPDANAFTLSLPSGRVRSVAVGASESDSTMFGGGDLVVAPQATALGILDSTFVILPRTGPPIGIDREAFGDDVGGMNTVGWQLADDGSTRFTVAIYPNGDGDVRAVSVGLAGDVRELGAQDYSVFGSSFATPDGDWIVNDAGGAYVVDPQGRSVRIDDGTVYAAAGDHRLVRTCDAQRTCALAVVTASTGARRILDQTILPDDFDEMVWGMTLSPDGTAVAAIRSRSTQERVLVDFDVGVVATIPLNTWSQTSAWAADSSGIFSISPDGQGLQFTDRSGESVDFAEDLGQILAIGVRHPASELDPVAAVVVATITPSRALGPTGIMLVGAGRAGGMSNIDIDAGLVRSWETAERLGQGPATLVASDGAIVALPRSDDPAFVTAPGVDTELGDAFSVEGVKLAGPTDATIWVPATSSDGRPAYRLTSIDGSVPATDGTTSIDLAGSELVGGDGRGGLVIARGGDIFAVGNGETVRLTTGDLIAIGATTAYADECDNAMRCSLVRIDRDTGDRTTLEAGFTADAIVRSESDRGAALGTTVSPDGTVFLARLASTDSPLTAQWFFVDTASAQLTPIADFDPAQPVIWNPAGTFAAVLSGTDLQVFDRAAAEMVALGVAPLRAIGPAAPGPAGPAE